MRSADLPRLVNALKPPVHDFVTEARVRIALVVNGAGQVLAQHGFTRSYEVMNVASLAAAAHASARALADIAGAGSWDHMYHGGRERQLFMAPLRTPGQELILVVIFDSASSLGIVQLFFQDLERKVAALPEFRAILQGTDQANFERDLEAGLEHSAPGEDHVSG